MRQTAATVAFFVLALPVYAADPKLIVFAAGPKDHGAAGRHEYEKDLASLKGCLEHSNISNITAKLYAGKVPDVSELKNAAVLVMESSGDRTPTEHHVLFPQDATTDHQGYDPVLTERFKQIDELVRKGMGIAVFHYATYVNNATARKYFLDWTGSFYESGASRTVVADWAIAPTSAKHPILSGVEPWTNREEFYINYRMGAESRRTPLLIATPTTPTPMPPPPPAMVPLSSPLPPEPKNVEPSLVSWAIERNGSGGRGFIMTGVDWHKNLEIDSYRRELLNGIIWAAGIEVPSGGVQCKLPPE
jgi:type 1 glutamine amidotransferase